MDKLALKINSEWAVLNDDSKISIDRTSPIWNDSGTFSYPFTIPYESNRHIFGLLSLPEDNVKIDNIDYDFELYSDGILLLKGIIDIDEDEISDSIPMKLMSGTSSFNDIIQDLNCNDIPVKDKIIIGKVPLKLWWDFNFMDKYYTEMFFYLPTADFTIMDTNVSIPYPDKKFCNVQIVTSNNNIGEYNRPNSGICFYLLYFLDCLFEYTGINLLKNSMLNYEDFKRLAFFTTIANATPSEDIYTGSFDEVIKNCTFKKDKDVISYAFKDGRYIYATKESFPSVGISSLINDLKNAFGVRLLFDDKESSLNIVLIKDILTNKTVNELVCNIISISKTLTKFSGLSLTYDQDDDAAFNYTSKLNVEEFSDYDTIIQNKVKSNNTTCYVSTVTGNSYRVKVDEETGQNPALFEVGGFNSYKVGVTDNVEPEELKLNFKPVICNDVTPSDKRKVSMHEIISAVYVDVESGDTSDKSIFEDTMFPKVKINYKSTDWSALQDYDAGFTLGIMRGAGSSENYAVVTSTEDLGGQVWVPIAGTTAFTSDSIDDYGRSYDYNGVGAGAGSDDINKRFSLKLKATKEGHTASVFPNRGLADTFMSEYLYFMQNRKLITMVVEMSLAELLNIEWDIRYKIGNYTGFINKLSFDIDKNGLSEVEIELYMI